MTLQATVSASWVNTVLGSAQRLGVSAERLLAVAGIAASALQQERWPIDDITRLWRAAERCTGDKGLGLKTGAAVGPASLNVVSFLLQSSATLRAALNQLQTYQRLISDGGRFQVLAAEPASWVVYHPRQGELAFSPHQLEAVLAAVVSVMRWVTARDAYPLRVQFSHSQLGPLAGYERVFHCPLEFERGFAGLLLDNHVLDQPLPQADAALALIHQRHAAQQLEHLGEAPSFERGLQSWLNAQFNGHAGGVTPTRAMAAKALSLSERTLTRRLQAHGLRFDQLLDDARKARALALMGDHPRHLNDIALRLGFAEASPFYRAFRRWTGQTPAQWRRGGAVAKE